MSRRVRIEQFDREIVVEDGDTILQSALNEGLDYPFMCQQGQCGACKAQLISGQVDLGTYYNPLVLTEDERAGGQILACQAEPLSDCVISVGVIDGEVSHALRDLDFEVMAMTSSGEITTLRLANRSAEPFHFSAGQFARLSIDALASGEVAMANRPDEETLLFHIEGGEGDGFYQEAARLTARTLVRVEGPFGNAYLRDEHLGPIVLAGIGAACGRLLSIAETALKSGMAQQIMMFCAGVEGSAVSDKFAELVDRYRNFKLHIVEVPPSERAAHLESTVASAFEDLEGFHVYLSGGVAFCHSMQVMLVRQGLLPEHCYFDEKGAR